MSQHPLCPNLSQNVQKEVSQMANHDPLAKVCPLLEMCQTNFRLHYTPAEYISLDKSTMAFKGCVKFLQFNPSKPNKFHIKLFMVSEHLSGYIWIFSIHGKTCNELVAKNATLDPYCSVTIKLLWVFSKKQNYWIITKQFFWQLLQFMQIVRRNAIQGHIWHR